LQRAISCGAAIPLAVGAGQTFGDALRASARKGQVIEPIVQHRVRGRSSDGARSALGPPGYQTPVGACRPAFDLRYFGAVNSGPDRGTPGLEDTLPGAHKHHFVFRDRSSFYGIAMTTIADIRRNALRALIPPPRPTCRR
jgi:hypothetical protein